MRQLSTFNLSTSEKCRLAWISSILILWSLTISEDPPRTAGPLSLMTPVPEVTVKKPRAPRSLSQPIRAKKSNLQPQYARGIERSQFLHAFQRQAQKALLRCLKAWQPPPSSLALSGELNSSSGQFTSLEALDGDIPPCAKDIIQAMDFSHLSLKNDGQALTVQWRVDW